MCALRISTDLKNYIINQGFIKQMAGTAGTGGSCVIKIYSGSQPTNADAATNGTMLCEIIGIAWGGSNGTIGATSGTAALCSTSGYTGTAATTGTAGWARMETFGTGFTGSAGTFRIDGDVGTASTCTFVINSVSITAGGSVSLLTAPINIA